MSHVVEEREGELRFRHRIINLDTGQDIPGCPTVVFGLVFESHL